MFGKHLLTRLHWVFWVTILCLGWLNLSSCEVPSGQSSPPSKPFLRIEVGTHTAPIQRIDVDAAERYLVTASDDKTARVWDLAGWKLLQVLRPPLGPGDEGKLYAVAISPDGRTVAVGGFTGPQGESKNIYLFDRDSGRLERRIAGLPNVIIHLIYSPDGHYLAAALRGANGIRIYNTADYSEAARDTAYGDDSYWIDFDHHGRLVTTSLDGYIRLYGADFRLLAKQQAPGGKQPYTVRFAPAGDKVAVGFDDSTAVNVLSGQNLAFLYAPDTEGVYSGNMSKVAWSQDGQILYAGGLYNLSNILFILKWTQAGSGSYTKLHASTSTIMDLRSLAQNRLLFAAQDPAFGIIDAVDSNILEKLPTILDYRDDDIHVSHDGSRVMFGFKLRTLQNNWDHQLALWNLSNQQLFSTPSEKADFRGEMLDPPRIAAPGINITSWKDTTKPHLNGQMLELNQHEISRSLAITPDGSCFLLGTSQYLRLFDRRGKQMWEKSIPGVAWAINISGDGRLAVAAFADGTLRWYRLKDGEELLAFFLDSDGKRWVLWTPEGFFATSRDSEQLIGYHLNQGPDRAGEFIKVEQLYAQFYRPDLVAQSLQADGERAIQAEVARIGDVRKVLASGLPPAIELLTSAEVRQDRSDFALKFQVQNKDGGIGRVVYRIDGVVQEGRHGVGTGIPGREPLVTRLALPPGKHTVTVTAFNARNEIESTPATVTVQVDTPTIQPALYVLSIGVDSYKDQSMNLKYAAADAREVAQEMQQRGQGLFRAVYVVEPPLLNEAATLENINKGFAKLAEQVTENDVFVLYLAGQGRTIDGEHRCSGFFYTSPSNNNLFMRINDVSRFL